jgi:hypothetical protein
LAIKTLLIYCAFGLLYYKLYSYSLDYYLDLKRKKAAKKAKKNKDNNKLNKDNILNKEDNYLLEAFKILARLCLNRDLDLFTIDNLDDLRSKDLNYNYN